ncbi:MAG: substrate-binding domain-containing protein [Methylococcales bacterium]|nr:substrate-binding domain-containing protein [Methylococcales bacterium]
MKFFLLILFLPCLFTQPGWAEDILRMSTTTSTENSGLLKVLNPVFEAKHNIKMHVIAVGTGKALKIGGNGDVDIVFVHAPETELQYVKQGDFIDRAVVMHNDFVIVGPENDPAVIAASKSVEEALAKIASTESAFISRGDDSGTHKKEKKIWKQSGISPEGMWYSAVGQGMGAVLKIADDKEAYALTDRGTQIAYSDKISLKVQFEGDTSLFNPYHVMAVNPEKHRYVRYGLAKKYITFITSPEGQAIINNFSKGGEQLFYPAVKVSTVLTTTPPAPIEKKEPIKEQNFLESLSTVIAE